MSHRHNNIKISNATYISKTLEDKHPPKNPFHVYPLPMDFDPAFNRIIETYTPLNDTEREQVSNYMVFHIDKEWVS